MSKIAIKPTLQPELFAYSFPVRVYFENTDAGGVVYHGEALPELKDAYICADYGTGIVEALFESNGKWEPKTLTLPRTPGIAGIGKDPRNGDVLMANFSQGTILRLKGKVP